MYGKEKTAIPLEEYKAKHKEYRQAFNDWRELKSKAYETFNKSDKSPEDLALFAETLKKSWECQQKVKELKKFNQKREVLDIKKLWF